ncbi:MAG: AMP-binding protein [Bradymonadaceae bacterium]
MSETNSNDEASAPATGGDATWSVSEALTGRSILVTGATGFLGKVYASMLLRYHPDLERLYILLRERNGRTATERFEEHIARGPVFRPLAESFGEAYDEFLEDRIDILGGDITEQHLGLEADRAAEIADDLDAVVNCAGLTNFNPNLESALSINALSQRRFLEFLRLSDDPARYLHVSTAFVAGNRDGYIEEEAPGPTDYPRYDELGAQLDADREIDDCLQLIDRVEQLADDQERQSLFAARARERLSDRNLPVDDPELFEREKREVREDWLRDRLSNEGLERAEHWGWPNIYTYTKSLGERVLTNAADVETAIARPAIIESAVEYPEEGWIQGVNTSGPLSYLSYRGHRMIPTQDDMYIDLIPVDYVSRALIGITGGLLEDRHHHVYHLGTSDLNPLDTERAVELVQLGNRRAVDQDSEMSTVEKLAMKTLDSVAVSPETFERYSAPQVRNATKGVRDFVSELPTEEMGSVGKLVESIGDAAHGASRMAGATQKIIEVFLPFIAENKYIFVCRNLGELTDGLTEGEQRLYEPPLDELDWREYWIDIHIPALQRQIYPQLDEKLASTDRVPESYTDLRELFDATTTHHDDRVAMQHHAGGTVEQYTYGDLDTYADRAARALQHLGVEDRTPVVIAGENSPRWGISYFGIVRAGGIAVPVEPGSSPREFRNFAESAGARVILLGESVDGRVGDDLREELEREDVPAVVATFDELFETDDADLPPVRDVGELPDEAPSPPAPLVETGEEADEVASLIFTSGTTGQPKGVMLTHDNFTSLLANLKSTFSVDQSDDFVSVLPLHHTFEFTCGFLLPLSEGATITYVDELEADELVGALESNQATAMVGVPALWQLLHRRIRERFESAPAPVPQLFEALTGANRWLRENLGLNLGPLIFEPIHDAFGGRLDYMVSGGAALPEHVLEGFYSLGFDLYEGYGLTEAAPVLTVNRPDDGITPGSVGRSLPEVEVDIAAPDEDGVGEVVARGPNIMEGYLGRAAEPDEALDGEWLKTGDLGRIDENDELRIVGREKDVIVTPGGENVYPDELEDMYGDHEAIDELSVVGLPDDSGSERVACLVRPELPEDADPDEVADLRDDIRDWFQVQASRTASHKRIQVLRFWDGEFPRTATRKIKRNEVVEILEQMLEAERASAKSQADDAGEWQWLDELLGQLAGVPAEDIHAGTHLVDDLGFDSLMLVEMASILDDEGYGVTAEQLAEVRTNHQLRELLEERAGESVLQTTASPPDDAGDEAEALDVPTPLAEAGKSALYRGQMAAYERLYDVDVQGRSHIPHNDPNVLVVSNHTSHLDMGLVKYALGEFGRGIRALAAADYFFSTPVRRTYFEQFTNLIPVERSGSLEEALSEARTAIEHGETLLIFPEGTRSTDGSIQEFRDGLGYLVATHEIDVLPVCVSGTHRALPKGRSLPSPTERDLGVRIGERLTSDELLEAADAHDGRDRFSAISNRTREEILDLRDRGRSLKSGELEPLFEQLDEQFDPEESKDDVSYYFSLGDVDDHKWSIRVDEGSCRVAQGKPENGLADCVVKTSPDMFRKIVEEGYVPGVEEFMSGDIKTNDPDLLRDFRELFDIGS